MKTILNIIIALTISLNHSNGQEKLLLTTDRDIYIGGEEIWLTIQNLNNDFKTTLTSSKVVYIELINRDKIPVVQEKVYLNKGTATSMFEIPDSVSTGNYVLRAYTNWMTNFSADDYEKKLVSIINPFTNNSLSNIRSQANESNRLKSKYSLISNEVNGLNNIYKSRQKVIVDIADEATQWKNVTVSVVKTCLLNNTNLRADLPAERSKYVLNKIPEYKGEVVSGIITERETHKPIVNERFVLSFVGQETVFKTSTTDSLGRFAFEVKQFGEKEMVIETTSPLYSDR